MIALKNILVSIFTFILLCVFYVPALGQETESVSNPVLQDYITEALESNQGLKQAQLDYASNLVALKGARGLFFPNLSLEARYSVADGGRVITFPIGDLLNPVYSTLNILTLSENFPQIENEEFMFYRAKEHETKLRLVQPIFQADLIHNVKIREQGSEIAHIGLERYREELICEVAKAYYGYQKAYQLNALADTTMDLVKENLRVSKSLFNNDKVTKDVVYRSEAEISKVEVQRSQTRHLLEASRSYFNFLLNRELATEIDLSTSPSTMSSPISASLEESTQMALNNRVEFKQLKAYKEMNARQTALYKGSNLPGLYGVVDYGFQGPDYKFTQDDDFVMASLLMSWNIFQGRTNHHKVQQSIIEGEKLESIYAQTEQQISLEVVNRFYALQAAGETVRSASKQAQLARRAYTLIQRKYQEGQASLLELIDARTSLTLASSNVIVARSDYFSSLAEFNYATGQGINSK